MTKLRPLGDRVVVERGESEERSPGGIVLPDAAKERRRQGTVVAVGRGRQLEDGKLVPPGVGEGETVCFGSYAGTEVKLDGKEYLILNESEILGVVTK